MPPEERTDHEQGETQSGVSVFLKNNSSLSSAKSTIFDLFREGFSLLFKAAYLKPTHSGNLPSHCGIEEGERAHRLSPMKAFCSSLRCTLWGPGTYIHEEGKGPASISIKSSCRRPLPPLLSYLLYFAVMLASNKMRLHAVGQTALFFARMLLAFQVGGGITKNICTWAQSLQNP